LESLLGQALTLDDEPTLVRAVKAVKRSMARNQHLRDGYIDLFISFLATLIMFILRCTRLSVSIVFLIVGMGRVFLARGDWIRGMMGVGGIVFGVAFGVPVSGVMVPYHRLIIWIYNPAFQSVVHVIAVTSLVMVLGNDVVAIVRLKVDEWRKLKKEEEARQQKLRGIFYMPAQPKGKGKSSTSWNSVQSTKFGKREAYGKSQNVFAWE
jgi:hypothetical protein